MKDKIRNLYSILTGIDVSDAITAIKYANKTGKSEQWAADVILKHANENGMQLNEVNIVDLIIDKLAQEAVTKVLFDKIKQSF